MQIQVTICFAAVVRVRVRSRFIAGGGQWCGAEKKLLVWLRWPLGGPRRIRLF
jgi:hypothetical protein